MAPDAYSEFDSIQTVDAIAEALRSLGHRVEGVEAASDLPSWLQARRVDFAFNIAEGTQGQSREAQVPALLEFLGIPYTGSGVLALALALDKARTKQILRESGVPTPNFQRFENPGGTLNPDLRFPLIVKPNHEGSGKGISVSSVVENASAALGQVRRVHEQYRQPVLVEEFIEGTELSVGVLGNAPAETLPILEIDFSTCEGSGESFYSWRMKEHQGNEELHLTPAFRCPARLSPEIALRVREAALQAHRAVGCRDFSRVDVRLDASGIPHVLEINPLPGLDPLESNFPRMAAAAGLQYAQLIGRLVELVAVRLKENSSIHSSSVAGKAPAASVAEGNGRPVAA
ncbi:MAG: ATP-grasp domain-containing protein [Candidatus Omnitrophica bacterium]|nr:ATP-grasp domain-containing protein [Candidatus Omnitrophota bacterium]